MNKLFAVIPAYNEEKNIENVVKGWHEAFSSVCDDFKLVVVNDGSKDSTYEKLLSLQEKYPSLIPLTKENGGHGPTLLYGYRYAIDNGADFIFQTDSDGQTNPDEFSAFWEERDSHDAIIGWRKIRGDGKARKFVENVLCLILKIVFGVSVHDANAPFRLMRADLVDEYIKKMPTDFNLPNVMLTVYFKHYQKRVAFKEISFKPRQAGTNSINFKKIVAIGIKAVKDFYGLKRNI